MSTYTRITSFCLLASLAVTGFSKDRTQSTIIFKENKGQVVDQNQQLRNDVKFYGNTNDMSYYLKNTGISYQLYQKELVYRVDVSWPGANPNARILYGKRVPFYENYYTSSIPVTNVSGYQSITYQDVYPSIDLRYYSSGGSLKYDYVVKPGGDYKTILLQIDGAERIQLNNDGTVTMFTPQGNISEGEPIVYQDDKKLNAHWRIDKSTLSFDVTGYDPHKTLVIDPLVFSTGVSVGTTTAAATFMMTNDVAADATGSFYMVGSKPYGTITSDKGFLQKCSSTGTVLFTQYYPSAPLASAQTTLTSCALDGSDLFMIGYTSSANYLATTGAHQTAHAGGSFDGLIIKTDTFGATQWVTYYGGAGTEQLNDCQVDVNGNLYAVGMTSSSSAVATAGSQQAVYGGGSSDGLVIKLSTSGIRIWGTYYGGVGKDIGSGCTLDGGGNLYVGGSTNSSSSIATPGAYQTSMMGSNTNGYVLKLDTNGIRQWATYYGDDSTTVSSIDADVIGNVYFSGLTTAASNISTTNVFQSSLGGMIDGYLAKFTASGARGWCTYIGGASDDKGLGCAVNNQGKVYISGNTRSNSNIATPGAYIDTKSSTIEFGFLLEFDTTGQRLWGTYVSGSGIAPQAAGQNCFATNSGDVYLAGVFRTTSLGLSYPYVWKFGSYAVPTPSISAAPGATFCQGDTVTLSTGAVVGAIYQWYNGNTIIPGATATTYKATVAGNYKVRITSNASTDTSQLLALTQLPKPSTAITKVDLLCNGTSVGSINITPSGATAPYTYTWVNSSNTTSSRSGLPVGAYISTTTSANGCFKKDTTIITQPSALNITDSTTDVPCNGSPIGTISLNVTGGTPPYTYLWSGIPGATTFASNLSAGAYTITVLDANTCSKIHSTLVLQNNNPMPSSPLVSICAVTVDSATGKNLVIYEKTGTRHASQYNIYRETAVAGQYALLGSNLAGVFSTYLDTSSNPLQQSYLYQMTETDSCSNEFSQSPYHKTIHLNANTGPNGEINLIWNQYEGRSYTTHYIMRSVNSGTFVQIGQVSYGTISFSDLTPPSGQKTYRIEIDLASTCNPTAKTTGYNRVSSNLMSQGVNGISSTIKTNVRIVPNPTNDVINIIGDKPASIRVLDIQGKLVVEQQNTTNISLKSMAAGVYVVRLYDKEGILYYYQKIIKE